MSQIIRAALVAVAVLGSVSAASARSALYDNATPRSAYDLNTAEGAQAFWESLAREGN